MDRKNSNKWLELNGEILQRALIWEKELEKYKPHKPSYPNPDECYPGSPDECHPDYPYDDGTFDSDEDAYDPDFDGIPDPC